MSKPHWYAPYKGKFDVVTAAPFEGPFVCVSFNREYSPFILGALKALLQRQMWIGSDAAIDLMTMNVHHLLYMFGAARECPEDRITTEGYEVMTSLCENLRYVNGRLQALCCGDWQDIDGQDGIGVGVPGQPGGGAPQPAPDGGEVCYHGNLPGGQQWLLPTSVSTGDVLTFSNFDGAAWDGFTTIPLPGKWTCPDGKWFVLGTCQDGTEISDAGDLLLSAPHMSIVVQIAGTWYSALSPILVPAGVSNAQVRVQLNDGTIGDNQGEYAFDVCVQNNQTAEFEHEFDFKTSPHGWARLTGGNGTWVAGSGWQADTVGADKRMGIGSLAVAAHTLLSMRVIGSFNALDGAGDRRMLRGAGGVAGYDTLPAAAGAFDQLKTSTVAGNDGLALTGDTSGNNTGITVYEKVIVRGRGPDPY